MEGRSFVKEPEIKVVGKKGLSVLLLANVNDRNISAHIPTLLAQHFQAPAKRSQHLDATYRNIFGCNMLRTFGHPDVLRQIWWVLKIELVCMPGRNIVAQTCLNDYNIM